MTAEELKKILKVQAALTMFKQDLLAFNTTEGFDLNPNLSIRELALKAASKFNLSVEEIYEVYITDLLFTKQDN